MINVAIVGLGWWGRTIAADVAGSDRIRVVAGVDPDEVSRAEVTRSVGVRAHVDLAEALAAGDVDAVVLCTPHQQHAAQIRAAAEAGKHVFCEKPFATTSEEARDALAAIRDAGVHVGVGHERRFEPAVQDLQRLVGTGGLGIPLVFEGNFSQDKFLALPPDNWRLSSQHAPVGPLSATGIHLVDLAVSVLGRPSEVWCRLSTLATGFSNGDTLVTTIGFESGATATITAVLTTPFLGRVCVIGSRGWTEIRDRSHPERSTGWDTVTSLRGEPPQQRAYNPFPSVRANLEAFAAAVEGGAPYPIGAEEIQQVVDTFEAITRSASSGKVETVGASRR